MLGMSPGGASPNGCPLARSCCHSSFHASSADKAHSKHSSDGSVSGLFEDFRSADIVLSPVLHLGDEETAGNVVVIDGKLEGRSPYLHVHPSNELKIIDIFSKKKILLLICST